MAERPDVQARLREAAAGHRPDRERILARVTAGMDAAEGVGPHPAWGRPFRRPPGRVGAAVAWTPRVGASAGLVAMLAVGGIAVGWATEHTPARDTGNVPGVHTPPAGGATTGVPTDPGSPTGGRRTAPSASGEHATGTPSVTPSSTGPATPGTPSPGDGALRVEATVEPGSNAYWGGDRLALRTTERLTSLTVELRLARAARLTPQGAWQTLPEQDFEKATEERDGVLVYRWTLREGASVPPGEHLFAAQYQHPRVSGGRRDVSADRYRVTAVSGARGRVDHRGRFH